MFIQLTQNYGNLKREKEKHKIKTTNLSLKSDKIKKKNIEVLNFHLYIIYSKFLSLNFCDLKIWGYHHLLKNVKMGQKWTFLLEIDHFTLNMF